MPRSSPPSSSAADAGSDAAPSAAQPEAVTANMLKQLLGSLKTNMDANAAAHARRFAEMCGKQFGEVKEKLATLEKEVKEAKEVQKPAGAPRAEGVDEEDEEAARAHPKNSIFLTDKKLSKEDLEAHVIAPLALALKTSKLRGKLDAHLAKELIIKPLTSAAACDLERGAVDIVEELLKWAATQDHLAHTEAGGSVPSSAGIRKMAERIVRAKLLSHLRTRFANHVLVRALRFALPNHLCQRLPELPEAMHKDVPRIPDQALRLIGPALAQKRQRLPVAERVVADMAAAAEADPQLVPPIAIFECELCSRINESGDFDYLHKNAPVIVAFEELCEALEIDLDTDDLPLALLAYTLEVVQYKAIVGPGDPPRLGAMPDSPAKLAEELAEVVDFLEDVQACPSSYPPLRRHRNEEEETATERMGDDDEEDGEEDATQTAEGAAEAAVA